MKLIVGLGNPGKKYDNTRHNVGYNLIDYYLKYLDINISWSKKFSGKVFETMINNEKIIFLKPETYMNLSGNSVIKVINYYNISIDDILIISDDLDINLGNYKLKYSGSSGGHNGLKDIEEKLGTKDYKRLKIGISNNKELDTKDYVLASFGLDEKKILEDLFKELCHVLDDYFKIPFVDLMSKYNHKNR